LFESELASRIPVTAVEQINAKVKI
jgi:hypothetical protein